MLEKRSNCRLLVRAGLETQSFAARPKTLACLCFSFPATGGHHSSVTCTLFRCPSWGHLANFSQFSVEPQWVSGASYSDFSYYTARIWTGSATETSSGRGTPPVGLRLVC